MTHHSSDRGRLCRRVYHGGARRAAVVAGRVPSGGVFGRFALLDPERGYTSRMPARLALYSLRCETLRDEITEYLDRATSMRRIVRHLCYARLACYKERAGCAS